MAIKIYRPKPNGHDTQPNVIPIGTIPHEKPWYEDDDKMVDLDEGLYDTYLRLLKAGELLPGTTFETFEKLQHDFDIDIISKIKKRIEDKNKKEGIANLFMRLRGLA